jgi:ornithine cyclodeaminase/alanine dehydrogenase-like protein (mu-crystallin family)
MVVLDSETGIPQSALFDNGYLTDLRTGLAGAVAAKHLAREGEVVMGIIGCWCPSAAPIQGVQPGAECHPWP